MHAMKSVVDGVARLKKLSGDRDARMREIRMVRAGEWDLLQPGMFNDEWQKPIVANQIDVAARDMAEVIAPLPALNCSSRGMVTARDKKRAGNKNRIGNYYWATSKLAVQMLSGADRYNTYGFLPLYVELDFKKSTPVIRVEDPFGCYYENDRWGVTRALAKCWTETAFALAAKFPEHAAVLLSDEFNRSDPKKDLEVVRFCDTETTTLYCPTRKNHVLVEYKNFTEGCPAQVAERPGLDNEARGQFDQVMWVQLARARMALLTISAADKSVNAPTIVPRDMDDLPIGPDSVWVTDNPQGVRRLSLEVPTSAFALGEQLDNEVKLGARYPEGRQGGVNASVITGRGIQALMGGFDTQIKTAQTILGEALARATEIAFELDVKVFGGVTKTIMGTATGSPYELTYDPAKEIGDNYACDVTYGYAAGLSPNQAAVLMLQLRGDNLIDRGTVRRNLPFDINDDEVQRNLDLDETRDAIKQAVFGYVQNMGAMAASGADPLPLLKSVALFYDGLEKGTPMSRLLVEAFTPPPPTEEELAAQEVAAAAGAAAQGAPPDAGGPPGVAPGQAQLGPGGMPDIQTLIAGLRGGRPTLDASVSRRIPA